MPIKELYKNITCPIPHCHTPLLKCRTKNYIPIFRNLQQKQNVCLTYITFKNALLLAAYGKMVVRNAKKYQPKGGIVSFNNSGVEVDKNTGNYCANVILNNAQPNINCQVTLTIAFETH